MFTAFTIFRSSFYIDFYHHAIKARDTLWGIMRTHKKPNCGRSGYLSSLFACICYCTDDLVAQPPPKARYSETTATRMAVSVLASSSATASWLRWASSTDK